MTQPTKTPYETPTIKVMNEDEVLATFQVTSATATWWITSGSA